MNMLHQSQHNCWTKNQFEHWTIHSLDERFCLCLWAKWIDKTIWTMKRDLKFSFLRVDKRTQGGGEKERKVGRENCLTAHFRSTRIDECWRRRCTVGQRFTAKIDCFRLRCHSCMAKVLIRIRETVGRWTIGNCVDGTRFNGSHDCHRWWRRWSNRCQWNRRRYRCGKTMSTGRNNAQRSSAKCRRQRQIDCWEIGRRGELSAGGIVMEHRPWIKYWRHRKVLARARLQVLSMGVQFVDWLGVQVRIHWRSLRNHQIVDIVAIVCERRRRCSFITRPYFEWRCTRWRRLRVVRIDVIAEIVTLRKISIGRAVLGRRSRRIGFGVDFSFYRHTQRKRCLLTEIFAVVDETDAIARTVIRRWCCPMEVRSDWKMKKKNDIKSIFGIYFCRSFESNLLSFVSLFRFGVQHAHSSLVGWPNGTHWTAFEHSSQSAKMARNQNESKWNWRDER